MKAFLAFLAALTMLALGGCGSAVVPTVHAQASSPGNVLISWTAPTENTDNSAITGALTFAAAEMQPCANGSTCVAGNVLSIVATGISAETVQISNVPDGFHCYSVQADEVLPDGANVASVWTAEVCVTVMGSSAPQQTPKPPTSVQVRST